MVQQIKKLGPEIQAHRLADGKVLDDREIRIHEIGPETGVREALPNSPGAGIEKQEVLKYWPRLGFESIGLQV